MGIIDTEGVISTGSHPLSEKGHDWDASAAEKRIRSWAGGDKISWSNYRSCFMWYDSSKPEEFGSYKCPYCDIISGSPHVVFKACSAIIGAVHGSRSGISVPDSDKKGIYEQAAKQYKRFGEDPPPWEEK
jgi:hypothetical protein